MSYSTSLLLYQDEPADDSRLKFIFLIVPALMLVGSIYLWSSGESVGGLTLLAEAFFVGLIFWGILPRRYQVYDDHLRIVLGGPFAVKIGFAEISGIEVTTRTDLTVNFVSAFTRTYVRIVKKRRLNIAITPKNNDLFTDNANRAIVQWGKARKG